MNKEIWQIVLMVTAFTAPLIFKTVYYYGELHDFGKEHYALAGSIWGLIIGFASAFSLFGRSYLK